MGQILLNSIQNSNRTREVYKLMAPTLDDVWSVTELSAKAMAISARVADIGAESNGYAANVQKSRRGGSSSSGGGGGGRRKDKKKTSMADQKCYFWVSPVPA